MYNLTPYQKFYLKVFKFNLQIEYLPPYLPNSEEKGDAKLFASNVRELMSDHLGIPMIDMSLEDSI